MPSRRLLGKAIQKWLKYYCLLEQMLIWYVMFVILMIVMMNNIFSFCILCGGFVLTFIFCFCFLFYYNSNIRDTMPSWWLLGITIKRWLKYCLLEQMLITNVMFVILMILMMNSIFFFLFFVLTFLFWFFFL